MARFARVVHPGFPYHVTHVELNPVRGGLVERAADWPWPRARAHAGGGGDVLLAPGRPFPGEVSDWSGWLVDGLGDEEVYADLRRHTRTGRPLREVGFVERLESLLGRVLRPGKRGPKPNDAADRSRKRARKG